jgi:hypothetical protein
LLSFSCLLSALSAVPVDRPVFFFRFSEPSRDVSNAIFTEQTQNLLASFVRFSFCLLFFFFLFSHFSHVLPGQVEERLQAHFSEIEWIVQLLKSLVVISRVCLWLLITGLALLLTFPVADLFCRLCMKT